MSLHRLARPFLLSCCLLLSSSALAQTYTETTLVNFNGANGQTPINGVTLASDGNFYGSTDDLAGLSLALPINRRQPARPGFLPLLHPDINSAGSGTIFKMTPSGTLTTLYAFCAQGNSACPDGAAPVGGVIEASDGNFYGITNEGGAADFGSVYQLSPAGKLKTLYSFCAQGNSACPDGAYPVGGLIPGADGNFYGATASGGANDSGSVFKITPLGVLSTIYSFCSQSSCADGSTPYSGIVQGSDGNFYGTTSVGGNSNDDGIVFSVSPIGKLKVLHSFCSDGGSACTDGENPETIPVEASDGNFYGTAVGDGANGTGGVLFSVSPSGAYSAVYSFCGQTDCGDGYDPSTVFPGSDGNIYGVTPSGGGTAYTGTIFRYTLAGKFSTLYRFCSGNCDDGSSPEAVLQGTDGNFYGAAFAGGTAHDGTVFKLAVSPALPSPVQLTLDSASVAAGSSTTLSWKVLNAFSATLQVCDAFIQGSPSGAGTWTGLQTGSYSATTKLYTGSAKITPSAAGTYTYALTCGGTESGFATLTVTGSSKSSSSTTLAAAPNPATVGQSVTLTATVKPSSGSSTPTGQVSFSVAGVVLGASTLKSGVATLTASSNGLSTGAYPVIATYSGDSTFNSSASHPLTITLNKAPTSTALTASPTTVTPPASVTLTATVKRSASGATGKPTGSVTFAVGSSTLATIKLNASGVAILTASTQGQAAGSYPVTAKYSGDASDAASTSSAVTVTVK